MVTDTKLSPGVVEALSVGSLPDVQWQIGDDLCECTYQRIGWWTNPYLAETLEVRMCCIWAELYKQFPDLVRTVPAFWDYNEDRWVTETQAWNGETEMPRDMWYRQLARQQDRSLPEIRAEYAEKDHLRPKGKPRISTPLVVRISGEWRTINLASKHERLPIRES